MNHPDDAALLEVLYLDGERSPVHPHVSSCTECTRRLAVLGGTIEEDRERHASRIGAKPESFWEAQREEILARAVAATPRRGLLRLRPLLTAVMAVLLLAVGLVAIRDTRERVEPPAAVTEIAETELFDDDELRAYDPWQTDELESFHQVVQWEEWLEDDVSASETGTEEKS